MNFQYQTALTQVNVPSIVYSKVQLLPLVYSS